MCMPIYPYTFTKNPENPIISCYIYNKTSMEHMISLVTGKEGKCINIIKRKKDGLKID